MPGETDLGQLLAGLTPDLAAGDYVYVSQPEGLLADLDGIEAFATVHEDEGLTLVLRQADAERVGLSYEGRYRRITLRVHSSLEAVGLTAAVSGALAGEGIAANVIAGFYHDHVLVPADDADRAVELLARLSGGGDED